MKFISKSSNLLVILRPGTQAQPLTGAPAIPTISVRFKDGLAEVEQEDLIDMMVKHPGFNNLFVPADDKYAGNYLSTHKSSEPAHEITEVKFGTPISKAVKGGDKPELSPQMKEVVQSAAVELAKKMLPDMVKNTMEALVASKGLSKKSPARKKRKKRRKKTVKKVKKMPSKIDIPAKTFVPTPITEASSDVPVEEKTVEKENGNDGVTNLNSV